MSDLISASVKVLQGVGPARVKAYEKLGIKSVSDLIYHYPRAYENRGDVKLLSECVSGEKGSVMLVIGTSPKKNDDKARNGAFAFYGVRRERFVRDNVLQSELSCRQISARRGISLLRQDRKGGETL